MAEMKADAYFNRFTGTRAIATMLTQDNFDILKDFLTATVLEPQKKLLLQTPKGERVARVGQIVVRNHNGQVWVAKKEFYDNYQKIEE